MLRDASSSILSAHQVALHDERTTWYDEDREQAWCRFEDSFGRFSGTCSPQTTPNGSLRGSAGRQGASVSVLRQGGGAVPVLGQGRGERWLGCGYSQPLVQAVRGCRLSVMEAFGRISSSALPASSRCSHLEKLVTSPLPSRLF